MIRRLLKQIAGAKGLLILACLFALIGGGIGILAPYIMGKAVDSLNNADALLKNLGLLLLVYLVSAVMQWWVPLISARVAGQTIKRLRAQLFSKFSRLPVKFFDVRKHGDIMSILTNDMDSISDGISQALGQLLTGVITIIGTLIMMFLLNVYAALVMLVITPLSILIARKIASRAAVMFNAQQTSMGSLSGISEETISGMGVIKGLSAEKDAIGKFKEENAQLYRVGQKAQFYSSLVNPSARIINHIAYISVGVLGAVLAVKTGTVTVGVIASMLMYANQFAKPINEISAVASQIQNALAGCERVFGLLDEKEEAAEAPDTPVIQVAGGRVELSAVDFSYEPGNPVLKNINLEAEPGKLIAIVGPTGCGKTTIINLLMRFYNPDEGKISIDGTDICSVTRESLRRSVTMVLQDTWLFSGTIKENIAYGRPDASFEEIEAAAKAAYCHNFITRLPEGYDTYIEGNDSQLSQGQKQLLTIARAMLEDAPILVLDEATSSVDLRTEQNIQKAFNSIMKGRTSFVIAHRLSTIRNADKIIVINHGEIAEQGTHRQLLDKSGLYSSIYMSQFAGGVENE